MSLVHKHFYIDEKIDIELRHFCADRRIDMSKVLRAAVEEYLKRNNQIKED